MASELHLAVSQETGEARHLFLVPAALDIHRMSGEELFQKMTRRKAVFGEELHSKRTRIGEIVGLRLEDGSGEMFCVSLSSVDGTNERWEAFVNTKVRDRATWGIAINRSGDPLDEEEDW